VRTTSTVVLGLALATAASASPGPTTPASQAAPATASAPAAPAAAAAPAPAYYRIELAPTGSYVAIGAPVEKPGSVTFHAYPDGKLMMLRRSDVKKVSQITAKEAAGPANKDLVSIGNLAMQGGSAPASGGGGGVGRPGATSSGAAIIHGPQGAAMIPTRDGLAVTTDAAHANQGPSVVNVGDGVAVTSAPNPR
jgi:hypothetical protein